MSGVRYDQAGRQLTGFGVFLNIYSRLDKHIREIHLKFSICFSLYIYVFLSHSLSLSHSLPLSHSLSLSLSLSHTHTLALNFSLSAKRLSEAPDAELHVHA